MQSEQFDQQLSQQYQHDKALHPLPKHITSAVLKQAASQQPPRWGLSWRNAQLALSCAMLAVLGYLLAQQQHDPRAPLYYQLVVSHSDNYKEVQQHSVSSDASATPLSAQQQYLDAAQRSQTFHRQTGLLRQQQQQWQISVCNDLLLTIDRQLVAQLELPLITPSLDAKPQWVEFTRNQYGQLVAIAPTSQGLSCPQPLGNSSPSQYNG